MKQEKIGNLVEWIKQNYQYSEQQLKEAALKGGATEEEFIAALNLVKQQTSQLNYKGVGLRFLAFIIDSVVFGILLFVFWKLLGGKYIGGCHSGFYIGSTISINQKTTFYGLCGFPAQLYFEVIFLYYVLLEWKLGGTIGKLATGIRVAKTNGKPLDLKASLIRNVLRIIDFLPFFYLIGAILVWTSKSKQRLGDRLAKTVVISKKV